MNRSKATGKTRQELLQNMACSQKQERPGESVVLRKETAIFALQLIALKAEDGGCEWLLVFEHTDSAETYYYL
jgi:hypothetical protein